MLLLDMVKELTGYYKIRYHANVLDNEPIEIDFTPPFKKSNILSELEEGAKFSIPRDLSSQDANKYLLDRLKFLGDTVLDYVITAHLYFKCPGLTPGLIADLRSASVNNECYAQSTVKAGLHKHILHALQDEANI
ncbi:hypothetical protein T459_14361 [Capsicum annuum]|uniref:RNase III domain-containing protein n=1 Tax=Capsicum annuum TaxID=4072 RepID=A0A2G2ZH79_CAPAN|nr:hypothetical protein FXO37_26916 [Capsicum annuum]PHT81346.1 hypothetical protein T459_14361 [Capsicum annuum]